MGMLTSVLNMGNWHLEFEAEPGGGQIYGVIKCMLLLHKILGDRLEIVLINNTDHQRYIGFWGLWN